MIILLNLFDDFLNEISSDLKEGKIRENIIRTANIRLENSTSWKYQIYYGYRRIVDSSLAEDDEIIELRIPIGSSLFHNKDEQREIKLKIDQENKFYQIRLSAHPELKIRLGFIKSTIMFTNPINNL